MSCKAALETIDYETREAINTDLELKVPPKKFAVMRHPKFIYPFEIDKDNVYLPFHYAYRRLKRKRPLREEFPKMNVPFKGTLRVSQQEVKAEAITILNKQGSVILSMYCGFGKTITSINIACTIGLRTLVVVNRVLLMNQWKNSILKFCPTARVELVSPNDRPVEADFYVVNAQNVCKLPSTFFNNVGAVLVDEAHLIMAETLARSLQFVYPRYLIGLTATPYRNDGLDVLLDVYFGTSKVHRALWKKHTVYKVSTGFKPRVEKTSQGTVNWGSLLDSQANDPDRNELILDIIINHPDRVFLVLVKRVSQGQYLVNRLREEDEDVTDLIGNKQKFDTNSRIVVATAQKAGVGFDHAKLDTLVLAADLENYFVQYLGRVFRTENSDPIIFDFVDDNRSCESHFKTRESVYKEHGGTIKLLKWLPKNQ